VHRVCRSTIRAGLAGDDCNVGRVPLLRRITAFGALLVLVAAGRARLLQADEQRNGYGPPGRITQR
jgi:hypothetical protein